MKYLYIFDFKLDANITHLLLKYYMDYGRT